MTTDKTYFNGIISGQSWKSLKPASVIGAYGVEVNNPALVTYAYDQKYQFENNKYSASNPVNNSFTEIPNANREHNLTYDANGNIKTLSRTNASGGTTAAFNYVYQPNTNKLTSVSGYATYGYDDLGQMTTQNRINGEGYYLKYNVYGKVEAIYSDSTFTQIKVSYVYDEFGQRIRKTDHIQNISTYYVYGGAQELLAIYDDNGTTLQQKELTLYGSNRLGVYTRISDSYKYELTDHLGNVRLVINQDKVNEAADVIYYSDYYPFGSPLALANNDYRYGYQGQYAEADKETGWNAFELRNYDTAIGRWLTRDPAGQYASPYVGMGNNPVTRVDPDGGFDNNCCPILLQEVIIIGSRVGNSISNWGNSSSPFWANVGFASELGRYWSGEFAKTNGAGMTSFLAHSLYVTATNGLGGGITGPIRHPSAIANRWVTNPVPSKLARVVPGNVRSKTLGPPGTNDVFVTAANDIAGMNASQIANRLTIPHSSSGFRVIEFNTPLIGLGSPINRTNPGFVGFGRTAGGAREFVIPNQAIPSGSIIRMVQ